MSGSANVVLKGKFSLHKTKGRWEMSGSANVVLRGKFTQDKR